MSKSKKTQRSTKTGNQYKDYENKYSVSYDFIHTDNHLYNLKFVPISKSLNRHFLSCSWVVVF